MLLHHLLHTVLFFNGEFVTNEILSEKKIEKFLDTNIKKI
ncbi:YoaP domain-containing protein [Clostridioides difficile]